VHPPIGTRDILRRILIVRYDLHVTAVLVFYPTEVPSRRNSRICRDSAYDCPEVRGLVARERRVTSDFGI